MMNEFLRRTWAEIDLDALTENYHAIRSQVNGKAAMCCVVKADAYGHGAPTVARLYQNGWPWAMWKRRCSCAAAGFIARF